MLVMARSALFGGRQSLLVASCAYGFFIVNLALQGLGIFCQCIYFRLGSGGAGVGEIPRETQVDRRLRDRVGIVQAKSHSTL